MAQPDGGGSFWANNSPRRAADRCLDTALPSVRVESRPLPGVRSRRGGPDNPHEHGPSTKTNQRQFPPAGRFAGSHGRLLLSTTLVPGCPPDKSDPCAIARMPGRAGLCGRRNGRLAGEIPGYLPMINHFRLIFPDPAGRGKSVITMTHSRIIMTTSWFRFPAPPLLTPPGHHSFSVPGRGLILQ